GGFMATGFATAKVQPVPLGQAALVLDKTSCGIVRTASGGSVGAHVIDQKLPGGHVHKHIGHPVYEPFELEIGFAMANPVFEWISKSWKDPHERVSGSALALDKQGQAVGERPFVHALLTETTIPALD